MQTLTIRIAIEKGSERLNMRLLHTLVDTLEHRNVGEIWDESIGEDFMEVILDIDDLDENQPKIKDVLGALDLLSSSQFHFHNKNKS
jgi:hypothetical protein